jgi:hypothetical protein
MFNKLFGFFRKDDDNKPGSNSVPAIDLSLGYQRLDEFKTYLLKANYSSFETEYEKLSWDAKPLLNEGIALNETMAPVIEKWVAQRPDSYIALLFAGVSKTCLAWIARTAVRGAAVSEKRGMMFLSLLEEAHAHLTKADTINPDDAEICARMIRVCMGLGVDTNIVYSYFDAAAALVPNHLMAHLMMINFLNPKWRGSLEEMQAFATERREETGSSLLVTLQLFSIAEEWLYYDMNEEPEKKKAFFNQPALKAEVLALYNAYIEEADGSLLIPYVYNYFAFLFYKLNEKQQAAELIKKIPGKMTVYPWAYIGVESNTALQKLCAAV